VINFDSVSDEFGCFSNFATVEINVFGRPTLVSIRFHDLKMQEM